MVAGGRIDGGSYSLFMLYTPHHTPSNTTYICAYTLLLYTFIYTTSHTQPKKHILPQTSFHIAQQHVFTPLLHCCKDVDVLPSALYFVVPPQTMVYTATFVR